MPTRRARSTRQVALDAGGDVSAVDETGSTALHYVADKGCPGVVELLVEHGAGLNVVNHRGRTPLAVVMRGRGNIEAAPATEALLRTLGAEDTPGR